MAKEKKYNKVKCPITRKQFNETATPHVVAIGTTGQKVVALPKEFNGKSGMPDGTGSVGWYVNEKSVFTIDDVPCVVQIQLIITVIGSKESTAE